ncbi:unnamed protein product [Spirodela intermedia]|uniref:Uncharacterized protein n=1 Tax=Spirodela intermedia TaxID=51605 RepID=A0A7I8IHP2_SPIIN|nr:unnamed protein product [Spirodela intermedia]CAA6657393.1 unnamed protein product [Spirodela intermedia]
MREELQKSKLELVDLLQQFLQQMYEKIDEFKNSVSENLLALEKKDPTASMASQLVRNSLESIHDQSYQPWCRLRIKFPMETSDDNQLTLG